MLTWDDYNQEDSMAATAAPDPAVVAAAAKIWKKLSEKTEKS